MSFFRKIFAPKPKQKREFPNVKRGEDPFIYWEKIGELGDGAFGKVYKAKHKEDDKLAALKIVPISNDEELEDFVVEIDILSECKHPNIVGLYEAFLWDSKLHIFIEFCAGGAVDDIIVELDHGLSETQIKCIAKQMFEGLRFLHSSKCIHRDIKAGNILLCPDGTIRLADFGVSAKNKRTLQKRETYIGTPYWMAPEVIACETCKDVPYDYSADIWSAGITLLEMAEMNPPHHEMSPMRVLMKITKAEPPTLEEPSKWSPEFSDLLKQCLQKNPERRPSSKDILEHPFFQSVEGTKPLRILYLERRAEVIEKLEELPEFQDKDDSDQDSLHSPSDNGPVPSTASSAIGPEISVVCDDQTDGTAKTNGAVSGGATPPKKRLSIHKEYHFQTLSRVRTFEVDGQVISTKTTHIVDTKKNFTISDSRKYKLMRKQDLRELKVLQREEQKEAQILQEKVRQDQELMEKRFDIQREELEKKFEVRLDSMKKAQKKEIEKLESSQEAYFKSKTKKLKQEQAKEMKKFKEELKQEEKLVTSEAKLEIDTKSLTKAERKRQLTKRLSDLNEAQMDRDKQFQQSQSDAFNAECTRLQKEKRETVHQMEKQFLIDQQNLIRARESELWEMEQQQIQEKHQLLKHQLKEAFFMHRHQMHMKHKKEVEQHQRVDTLKMEVLRQKHILEGRRLPKQLKQEFKNQYGELRKQLRAQKDPDEKEKLRELESQNSRRLEYELRQLQEKHVREEESLKMEQQSEMKELETIQSEKKQMLIQQENEKMKERDDQYTQQLKDWRVQISQRKKELEAEFTTQKKNLQDYFNNEVTSADSATLPAGPEIHARSTSHNNVLNRYSMDPTVLAVLNTSPVS